MSFYIIADTRFELLYFSKGKHCMKMNYENQLQTNELRV